VKREYLCFVVVARKFFPSKGLTLGIDSFVPTNTQCEVQLNFLEPPNIEYAPKFPGSKIETDYSEDATHNIVMDFSFNADDIGDFVAKTEFAVVITENRGGEENPCGKDTDGKFGYVLYASEGALVNGNHDTDPEDEDLLEIFNAWIETTSDQTSGQIFMTTNVENFCAPVYQETNKNCPNEEFCKGKLSFCVEIQAIICDAKMDFVDVAVDITFDLQVECDGCGPDVILTRADPIIDHGHTQIGEIECSLCDESNSMITQGEVIDACIFMLTPGACVRKIHYFDFSVKKTQFDTRTRCVIPDGIPAGETAIDCLPLITKEGEDNPDYDPEEDLHGRFLFIHIHNCMHRYLLFVSTALNF
jgi:hypothetical protein